MITLAYDVWVLPIVYPWRWLSIVLPLLSLAAWLYFVWRERRTRNKIVRLLEPLIEVCARAGYAKEAAELQTTLNSLEAKRPFRWGDARLRKESP